VFLRAQAKSGTPGDDPQFRGLKLAVR
jgi:hypothetical protein